MSSWSIVLQRCQTAVRVRPFPTLRCPRKLFPAPCLRRPWIQARAFVTRPDHEGIRGARELPNEITDNTTVHESHVVGASVNSSPILTTHGNETANELSAGTAFDDNFLCEESLKSSSELSRLFVKYWDKSYNDKDLRTWQQEFQRIFGVGWRDAGPYVSVQGGLWASELLKHGDSQAMKSQWLELPANIQRLRWGPIMLHCLTRSARGSLLLLNSLGKPYFDMTMDCLLFLKRCHWGEITESQFTTRLYDKALAEKRDPKEWPLGFMNLRHLGLFLESATLTEGRKLLDDLKTTYGEDAIRPSIVLQFLDFFTAAGDVQTSLTVFKMLPKTFVAESPREMLSRCTNLLKLDSIQRDHANQNFAILPRLLELGVQPDLIIHSIVIKNAFEAAMSGVGWDLYRFIQDQNLPANGQIILALLKDALARRNMPQLNELFSTIRQRDDLARDPYIVTYVMNIVRVLHASGIHLSPDEAFSRMLPVYTRAFNAAPLKRLRIVTDAETAADNAKLPKPDPRTLAFTIWSYVLIQKKTNVVKNLWSRFQEGVQAGDATFIGVAGEDVFYNGFATFYSRRRAMLPSCIRLIQYMLGNDLCKPTPRTWGIVLMAFLKHGDFEGARKVRAWMAEQGVEPDKDTRRIIEEQLPRAYRQDQASAILERYKASTQPPTSDEQLEPEEAESGSDDEPPKPNDFLQIKKITIRSG